MLQHKKIFDHFISKEALSGFLLFGATILAVIVANLDLTSQWYYDVWHMPFGMKLGDFTIAMNLNMWINDGLMALFFLMVGLEIKRELLLGELSTPQKATFPVVAAIGGMVIPALFYLVLNPSNPMGFGVPMATDIAFALGILLLLGNKVHPSLKLFLVAFAVVDDLGAVMLVAIVYTQELHLEYLVHFSLVYALIWLLNIKGVKTILPYLILGMLLWFYIHAIGIHATIAGVLLALAIPIKSQINERAFIRSARHNIGEFEKHIDEIPILNESQIEALEQVARGYYKVQNPLVKLQHQLHNLSAFVIMPLFAFANAGVMIDLSGLEQHLMIVLGVVVGLVVGKPVGIIGFTYFAAKMKWVKKPLDITWKEIIAAGFLGGIGFTMSIFITHLAFIDESIIGAVKLGIFVASFLAAVIGVVLINTAHKRKTSG